MKSIYIIAIFMSINASLVDAEELKLPINSLKARKTSNGMI